MRKSLLSLCMGALALSAAADVTTFMMEGCPACRYHGDGNIVEIPHGFVFTYQAYDKGSFADGTVHLLVQLKFQKRTKKYPMIMEF
ncbi:MAG: hypothetical protein K2J58_07020 [Muribaculaceae bacterium]|nr:hypothetical protein [Muribaculaceae bacterium]